MNPLSPGLHYGIPASVYHSDPAEQPSLSSTIARVLLNDSPAHAYAAHSRLGGNKKESTEAMGLGSMVHSLMDDGGEKDYEIGDFDSYKGGAARDWRDSVIASGKRPVLTRDLVDANPVADALRREIPAPVGHKSEVTAIWKEGDAYCRARFDRLVIDGFTGSVTDWKTCADVTDRGIIKSIVKYGYHIQVAFYLRGLKKCADLSDADFTLVFVETKAPYTVRRVQLTDMFMAEGNRQVDRAIELWQKCMKTNTWIDHRQSETFIAEIPLWMEDQDVEISGS